MNSQEWNPGKLLETSSSFWMGCTLQAGVKLDIFTIIDDRQIDCEEIALNIEGNVRGVTTLLNALVAMELLKKEGNKYSNTETGKNFLSKNSPMYMGYIIIHQNHLVQSWGQLDIAVKTGNPVRTMASVASDEERENFLMGMFNMAMGLAPQIVKEIDLSEKLSFIDIGGGPGTYAIHFCQQNPQMKAIVYDLPTTKPFALKTIERFGLSDRVDFMAGNYVESDIKGTYDVAWLSHVLHGEGPDDCQKIIKKTVSTIEKGGVILIHDFILNNSMDSPLFPALFSLNMLAGTPSGRAYSEEQLMNMLESEGVKDIKRLPLDLPNDSGVIMGTIL